MVLINIILLQQARPFSPKKCKYILVAYIVWCKYKITVGYLSCILCYQLGESVGNKQQYAQMFIKSLARMPATLTINTRQSREQAVMFIESFFVCGSLKLFE